MCGYDLRVKPKRKQRISWVDALLVVAILAVLGLWWRVGAQPAQDEVAQEGDVILPSEIPILGPTPTPTLTPAVAPTPTVAPLEQVALTHEVSSGETLLGIAGFYGVTVEDIQAANNMTDERIFVGDELIIPVVRPVENTPETVLSDSVFNYIVQQGDTVTSIAILFGATIDEILQANNLSEGDILRPGDVLLVPVSNVPSDVIDSPAQAANTETASTGAGGLDAQEGEQIYIEPRPIGPPDGATLSREEPVLIRWVSVDILAPNEWYVLLLNPTGGATQNVFPAWTKATSHRLNTELAPAPGASATYAWQVSVIRVKSGADGRRELEPVSPPSAVRTFTWQ